MRKNDRHQLVKTMIKEEKLGTQKEIQDRLEAQGIYVTQTTLSRDLREIGLTKVKKKGLTYYVLAHETEEIDFIEFLAKHVESVARVFVRAWERQQCWPMSWIARWIAVFWEPLRVPILF